MQHGIRCYKKFITTLDGPWPKCGQDPKDLSSTIHDCIYSHSYRRRSIGRTQTSDVCSVRNPMEAAYVTMSKMYPVYISTKPYTKQSKNMKTVSTQLILPSITKCFPCKNRSRPFRYTPCDGYGPLNSSGPGVIFIL